jgi:glycosyltransferase involved in cell wall biosynthesis
MKKVLLVSNLVFHYRIRIYNYFHEEFRKSGYDFSVITNKIQKGIIEPNFRIDIVGPSFISYLNYIRKYKPDYVITFLHLKNFRVFPITYYCKSHDIPVIYWNHGINLKTQHNKVKNQLYYHLHDVSDALILYSSNEKKHIVQRNQHKVFVANNTLNLEDLNFNRDLQTDHQNVYTQYGIREPNIVLFVGRITPNKQMDILLKLFRNREDIALVIVGPGASRKQLDIMQSTPNFYYLGEIYDREKLSALFNVSKIFTIPGNLGLALIEALFWGKPTLTLIGENTPEIIYMKDGENGYIAKNGQELEEKAVSLINDPELYKEFSKNARQTYLEEAHIKYMFKGFQDALNYVQKK